MSAAAAESVGRVVEMTDEAFEDTFRIRRRPRHPLVVIECVCCQRLHAVFQDQARCYCLPGCGRLIQGAAET